MAEVTALAYDDLKYHIQETWNFIELYNSADEEVKSINISGSANANWIHPTKSVVVGYNEMYQPINGDVPDTDTLQLEIVVTGADFTLPTEIAKSVIKSGIGNEASVETFEAFTMTQAEDELTIVHSIQVPQIV